MKRFYYLIVLLIGLTMVQSCEDDCTQDAYCALLSSSDYGKTLSAKGGEKVYVCHNGETLYISVNALQAHLDHGDTEGECSTLSSTGLEFKDGAVVEIPCDYELPFIHVTTNGTQWWYGKPNDRP